jgi:hypothetical protein
METLPVAAPQVFPSIVRILREKMVYLAGLPRRT